MDKTNTKERLYKKSFWVRITEWLFKPYGGATGNLRIRERQNKNKVH
jgi:hypothetical protein